MQDYNTIIGAIQMRLNKCPTRSVMDRFRIGSSTLNLIMSRYKALELTIDELEAMSPKKVENLFLPTEKSSTQRSSTSRFSVLLRSYSCPKQ